MAAETKKMTLKANDGKIFEIEEDIARMSGVLKAIIDEKGCDKSMVPLPNVDGSNLAKIIEFLRKHQEFRKTADQSDDTKAFNRSFFDGLKDRREMVELLKAVNYLAIKELLDVVAQGIADRIKNMTLEKVRSFFGVESDYTKEEENAFREKYFWAFEGLDDED
ncbi:hypothetical protein L6164_002107 [Bauhinia variegata]|uniref:Uncharacterized protein n=1 Tax=Bauhinia variegata TaxID=167791 RepID=A0ACB9PX63_BAUVA|nr:hypothetical protein L6164_002107 [Bauhinia variegata]